MAKPLSLLDQSSDSEVEFTINKDYAENYDRWRNKEEMQKLKDLSKDISDTSSESEEEDDPVIEKDFLKALSLIKSKDPVIYNENIELFKEESSEKKPKVKKEKPMYMKDYERKLVLERNGKLSDEDDSDVPPPKPSVNEELDEITKSLKAVVDSDDENDEGSEVGGLFQVRVKTKQEQDNEEEEYMQWLKGQKKKVDKNTEKELSFLHRYWNDSNLDEGEKFLRDYLLNQKFLDKDEAGGIPSYEEITADALQEEEETLQQQEQFEHKYNFRFEEPDPEFIKRYPRTVGDSLRRVDNKRKMKREEYTERKKREKDQKREELKRLKALKRKEIEEKFFKLKEASGKEEINFDEDDIESDFDPDKHDEKMRELFDDDYYAVEEEQKPEFIRDEEIDDEDWDHWTREQAALKAGKSATKPEDEEDSSAEEEGEEQGPDPMGEFEKEMIESTRTGKRKGRKKSLFAKIISEPKPLYDPDGKSFEEYLDEYYSLDYEDLIGELPVRFKYRKVIPNDFGLTPDEIFAANDKELNRWCSVKKTCQYRRDEEELYDVQAFKKKAQNTAVKEKILPSVYAPPQQDEDMLNANANDSKEGIAKRKKRNKKKKKFENNVANDEQNDASQEEDVAPTVENSDNLGSLKDSNKSKKKKRKNTESENSVTNDEQGYDSQIGDIAPAAENSGDLGTWKESKKSKKKKRKNTESESGITNGDEQGNVSQEWNITLGAENSDDLGSPKDSQKSIKKKKKNTESVSEAYCASENNDVESSETRHQFMPFHKDDTVSAEFRKVYDDWPKKKKHKNKAESESKALPNYSQQPGAVGHKSYADEGSSLNVSGSSVGRPEQSNSPSKKSKRKRNRNRSFGKGGNSSNSSVMPPHGDKRLAVSDSRLAAFGINPKRFKSSIIYSTKK